MNIDPMRVLKLPPEVRAVVWLGCFNEHRPDEGTETAALAGRSGLWVGFNEHRPDEGTETRSRRQPVPLQRDASMNIDPMRVLKPMA